MPGPVPLLAALLVAAGASGPAALPSPADLELARLSVPRPLVVGVVEELARDAPARALGGRLPAPEARARFAAAARAEVDAAVQRALPEEDLTAFSLELLAKRFTPAERAELLAWRRTPLAAKLERYQGEVRRLEQETRDPARLEQEREALARRTFTDAEGAQLRAFLESPAGQKRARLEPELTGAWLDFLVARIEKARPALDARLKALADAAAAP
jgi:hypothetical protein